MADTYNNEIEKLKKELKETKKKNEELIDNMNILKLKLKSILNGMK